jgi:cell division protein FtsL
MKECKVVQDLLPNYIENLTSNETNEFIESHVKDCKNCQKALENMKYDLQLKNSDSQKQEIDYMKKANKKMKIGRKILILIILVLIALILLFCREIYSVIAFLDINKKLDILDKQIQTEGSYKLNIKDFNDEKTVYYKDGIVCIVDDSRKNFHLEKWIWDDEKSGKWNSIISYNSWVDENGEQYMVKSSMDSTLSVTEAYSIKKEFEDTGMDVTSDSIFTRIKNTFTNIDRIKTVKLDGYKDCYYIINDYGYYYIDKETGFILYTDDDRYTLTIGGVTEDEIKMPDAENSYILLPDESNMDKSETTAQISNSDVEAGKILDYNFKVLNDENDSLTYFKKSTDNENLRIVKITSKSDYDMLTQKWKNLRELTEDDFKHYFALVIIDTNKNEEISFDEFSNVTLETNIEGRLVTLNKKESEDDYKYSGTLLIVPNSMDVISSGLTILNYNVKFN